jgi:signal transduction histidine kinase
VSGCSAEGRFRRRGRLRLLEAPVGARRTDSHPECRRSSGLSPRAGDGDSNGNGVVRVPPGQFRDSRRRDEPFDYETFSIADGLATAELGVAGQRTLALAPDGSLWAATLKGVARFDRRRLAPTTVKPLIYLTDVTVGRNTSRADGDIVLPPGTSHLRIDFSAVELSSPEKIRMQYRLDGVDSEWLDAGRDPHATYSALRAGTHTLRIRASNRSGVWDRQGVVFTIRQQPFFYHTRWFAAAMTALGVLLVGLIYRLRVRQISGAINARFNERLAERTRVARELHDTFLQTVQGSKLVADHALKDTADQARMVRAMEQLSTWLERATEEGRAALNSLRASTTEKNDLAEAFRRAIDECRGLSGTEASFTVSGDAREMHPIVRDEVYRIGYEAIRNACVHAGAAHVAVRVEYAHDLTLRISDNGGGIDAEIAEHGKDGHFGLPGMRERAQRIGGKFTLSSTPGAGTNVTVIVPGRIAFAVPHHNIDPRPA